MAKPETSEQQQSYFYVVWPEERSPAAAATASTATNLIAMNAGPSIGAAAGSLMPIDTLIQPSNSSPPICTGLGTHSGVVPGRSSLPLLGATGHSPGPTSRTTATASGTEESDSSDAYSPVPTTVNQSTTAAIAELQTVTITDSGEFSGSLTPITSTTPHNVLISPKNFGLAANGSGSLTTVYNPVSSPGLIYVSDASSMLSRSHAPGPVHRGNGSSIGTSATAMLHPIQENQRRQKHLHSSVDPPPLRSIGTWAELALGNLQKILKAVSNHEEASEEGGPMRKRICIREMAAPSQADCLECEVKDAEINVLRKRVMALQDQMVAMNSASATSVIQHKLPNGNLKSPLSPSSLSPTPQQMETTIQLQMDPMHLMTKELLQVRRRSRPSSEHTSMAEALLTSTAPPEPQPQPGEAIELVSGSGVYILAYRLEEARREAKTGTQLARKLMDCFWDKDTLAKSTLTPRSKFQYQQLDPKIIKAIEVYCLTYDNTVHGKDIHATMTDKCCQARSRYRVLQ